MTDNLARHDFDNDYYLQTYPDVAASIAAGEFLTAWAHYLAHGRAEGRMGRPPAASTFSELWYLEHNPDVAEAIENGHFQSGYDHWIRDGRHEGRPPSPGYDEGGAVNAEWYLQTYPLVAAEIGTGLAADAKAHFETIGRFRGYLPNRFASRPANPARIPSCFGGLWPDQANALDLVEGRLEIGKLTSDEARMLRQWIQNGFVVLPGAVPDEIVGRAAETLQRAYSGDMEGVQFECFPIGGFNRVPWDPTVKEHPAKALDLHWLSQSMRDLIFADPICKFLELIFERRALASQSLTFLRGSAQGYHQDTLYVPFSLPTQFVAAWIALEDVSEGGGELTYFPGSHKMPEHLYGNRFKTLYDAQRVLGNGSVWQDMVNYSETIERRSREEGLVPQKFMAKKGDVLFWHADLAHGGGPISDNKTRASVVAHYCPKEIAPLTFEQGNMSIRSHNGRAYYTTNVYQS